MALEGGGGGSGSARGVRAGAAYVELNGKDNTAGFFARMKQKFAGAMKALAATAVVGLGAGLAAIPLLVNPLLETITDLRKVDDVAKAFGVTGRAASGLFGVLGAVGGDFKENIEGIVQFSGTMDKALAGVGQGAELFDGLNVTAKELAGLGIDEQFYRVLGAIRELPQGLQEGKLAMLGGTDSLKQWQQLLSMSEADVRKLADKLAFSNAELRQAAEAGRAYQQAVGSIGRAWQQVAVGVAPLVKQLSEWAGGAAEGFTAWIRGRSFDNLFAEVWVRAKIGAQELIMFLRDGLTAVWKYVTSPGNLSTFADYLWKLVKALVGYVINSIATAVPIITQGLAGVARNLLQASATIKFAAGDIAGGKEDIRVAKILGNPQMMRSQLKKVMAADAKAFDEARAGLSDELDDVYKQFLKSQWANRKQDAMSRGILNRELNKVLGDAARQRNTAVFADFMESLQSGDPARGMAENMAKVSRAFGLFGGNSDFVARGLGGGRGNGVEKRIDTTNKILTDLLKTANDLAKRPGFVVT